MKNEISEQLKEYTSLLNVYRCFPKIEKKDMINTLSLSLPTLNRNITVLSGSNLLIYDDILKGYTLNNDFGYYVGIGIGSTQIKLVFLDFDFIPIDSFVLTSLKTKCNVFNDLIDNKKFVLGKDSNQYGYFYIPTPKTELSKLTNIVNYIFKQLEILNDCLKSDNNGILGIGISFSGAVDIKRQIIKDVPNISYIKSLNFDCIINQEHREYLNENMIPIYIDHNAKTTAIAEKYYLYKNNIVSSQNKNIAILYMGFGISSGIIINSRLYRGNSNFSGEIGHIPIPHIFQNDETECCGCGSKDCLEFRIRKDVFQKNESDFKLATTQELIDILNNNPERLELFIKYIGYAINYLTNILNIELIVFSGKLSSIYEGVIEFNKYFMDNMYMYGLSYTRENCKFSFSRLGLLSSAIGAAIESAYPDNEEIEWPVIK